MHIVLGVECGVRESRKGELKIVRHHHVGHELLVDGHELGDERLNVENVLVALLHAMLVDGRKGDGARLDRHVAVAHQILDQTLEDQFGRNALRQQIVQAFAHLLQSGRRLFEQDLVGGFAQIDLPVEVGNLLGNGEWVLLHFAGFQHEDGAPEIALRFLGDAKGKVAGQGERFFFARALRMGRMVLVGKFNFQIQQNTHSQNSDNILVRRRRHPNAQTTTPDGWNHAGRGIHAQNDAAGGHVFLHCATQRMLGVFGQFVHLGQDDDLEFALSGLVELMRLGDLLDQIDDHHTIVDACNYSNSINCFIK